MKVFRICVTFVLCAVAVSLSAYTPHRIEPVDTRAEAFGGPYYTDDSSVYSLFSNPATLAFAEKKTLWPPIAAVGMGGPLDKMFKFSMDLMTKRIDTNDQKTLAEALLDMIGDSGFSLNARIGGPLTFGAIRNNFGWGFVNTIYSGGNIFSLSRSDITTGADLGFAAGYAFPLDFGKAGVLSIGLSGRTAVQLETVYTQGITALFTGADIFDSLPVYLSLGLGFDMGVQYRLFDMVNFSLVWQDVYSPVWTKGYENFQNFSNSKGGDFKHGRVESKLGFGTSLDFHTADATRNIVSKWGIYVDYNNLWPILQKRALYRNPILELSFGTEAVFFKILALRAGVNEMYPAAGLGLNLGKFKMDFSVFGKELGFEPGYNSQLNMGFSMAIKY